MKKIISILLLFITLHSFAQNDTTKYFESKDYGWRYKRIKAELALVIPTDTVSNKLVGSVVMLNNLFYIKTASAWSQVSGGGSGAVLTFGNGLLGGSYNGATPVTTKVDTSTISTKANVSALLTGYASGASVVKYTDTAAMLSSYYNKTASNSLLALELNVSDTAAMLSNYYNKTAANSLLALKLDKSDSVLANRITADRIFTNSSLALKLDKSDSVLANRITADRVFVNASLPLKVNISDTSSMLTPYIRTQNWGLIKTAQAIGADSSLLSTKANVNALLTGYTAGALVVKYTDTAAMLSNYYNKTSLNSLRALDVKYTDTASLLTPYIRTANYGTIKTGQALGIDTSALSTKANVNALLTGYTAGALVVKYTDTASMLATHPNTTLLNSSLALKLDKSDSTIANRVTAERTFANAALALKVNISDTSAMLGNYVRTPNYGIVKNVQAFGVDTSTVSTKANVLAQVTGYTKYSDTATMLAGYKTFYPRAAISLTNTGTTGAATYNNGTGILNIPTYGSGTVTSVATDITMIGGAITTSGTLKVDTAVISTKSNVAALLTGYAAGASVVKYTDTASMLGNYVITPNYGITKTSQAFGVDTTKMIPYTDTLKAYGMASQYFVLTHGGGGGGSVTLTGAVTGTGTGTVTTTLANSIVAPANINATGTPSSTTYFRGDGTWSSPSGAGTVTSVAINNASGLTGATPITGSGTIGADTSILSTKANVTASLLGYASNALVVKYTDTTSMLSPHPNLTYVTSNLATKLNVTDSVLANRITADRVFVNASLPLKLNISDTAAMLGSKYYNKTYIDANVATKQNTLTLTTTGTSGAATLIGATLNIPSYTAGTGTVTSVAINNLSGLTGTTPITTTGTIGLDTTIASTKANVTAKLIGYAPLVSPSFTTPSLGVATATSINTVVLSGSTTPTLAVTGTSSISGSNTGDNAVNTLYSGLAASKVNVSDTATMLSAYYNKTASDSKFFTIANAATKLNISDTATMLSTHPNLTYVTANLATKQNTISLTTTGTSGVATLVGSTLNIPNYASGGGGTTTNALTLGSGLTGTSFNGSVAVTATVDTAAFKIATKTDIKGSYYTIDGNVVSDSSYFTIKSLSGLQVDTVRLKYSTLTGSGGVTSLTTTGTSGAATLTGSVLNIPIYSGGGGSMSIGGSITSATAGSVLFAGTAGVLSQSNANLFWDNTNSYLGLGNATPHAPIEIANYATLGGRDYQTLFRPPTGIGARFAFVNQATTTGVMMGEGTGGNGDFVIRTAPDINITAGTATWTDKLWITNAGNTILNSTTDNGNNFQVTGTTSISSQLNLGAGTATTAPISFTPTSAVLQTTPTAGDIEVDANGIAYYSHNTSSRGVMDAEQFISLTTAYTLTSQTAAQKAFNSTTNGALTAKAATSYYFEGLISLTAMSATSGSFGFALGGTATLTSVTWTSNAVKATATGTAATNQMTYNTTAANTTVATASTGTAGYAFVKGIVRVNAAGTLIPSVSLGVAAAAVVGTNSYFRIIPIGTNTITNVGNWN